MSRYPFFALFALSLSMMACAGGKGCGPTYNPGAVATIHEDFYYLELGKLTPDKIQDGILVIETTMPESEKARLKTFLEDAKSKEGYREDQLQFVHISGYIEHEDHLHRDFVYGSAVYTYEQYFCSDVRLFTDNSVFPNFDNGLPFAVGKLTRHLGRRTRYEDGRVSTEQNSYHNPSGFATYPVPELGVQDDTFYNGNFKIRVEAGTSITKDNIPKGKFFLRLYLRMATVRNGFNLRKYEPTTPKCGPYLQSNNAKDMGADMNDMVSSDASPDMPDMKGDMTIGDMGKDATQDMPASDMRVDADMPGDLGMD